MTFTKEQLIKRIDKQIDINATIIERLGDDSAAASELAVDTATMDIKILDIARTALTTSERAELESARLHIAELEAAPPAPVGDGETPVPLMPDFPGRTLTQRECYRIGVEAGKATKDGCVMVPVEPTAEMISSGIAAHYERTKIQIHDRPAPGPMQCAYVAMIAAAPRQDAE